MKESLFDTLKQLLLDSLKSTKEKPLEDMAAPSTEKREKEEDKRELINDAGNSHLRVFGPDEREKLSLECQRCILQLEGLSLLSPSQRETLIYKAMDSQSSIVNIDELKWIVMGLIMGETSLENLVFLDFVLFSFDEHTAQ
jgi:Smg protein